MSTSAFYANLSTVVTETTAVGGKNKGKVVSPLYVLKKLTSRPHTFGLFHEDKRNPLSSGQSGFRLEEGENQNGNKVVFVVDPDGNKVQIGALNAAAKRILNKLGDSPKVSDVLVAFQEAGKGRQGRRSVAVLPDLDDEDMFD